MKDDALKVKEKFEQPSDIQSSFKSFFETDSHEYIVRKSERLSAAVHLVTSYIKDTEPIRARMRTVALEIVQIVSDVERLANQGHSTVASRCVEMASLLDTAEIARMIAKSNVSMIGTEYAALATFIRDRFNGARAVLSLSGLVAPATPPVSDRPVRQQQSAQVPPQASPSPIGQPASAPARPPVNPYIVHQSTQTNPMQGGRRSEILRLIDEKGVISIKDAVQAIPSVSEKTVQRELGSLVDEGVLKKQGERRWSTYSRAA